MMTSFWNRVGLSSFDLPIEDDHKSAIYIGLGISFGFGNDLLIDGFMYLPFLGI